MTMKVAQISILAFTFALGACDDATSDTPDAPDPSQTGAGESGDTLEASAIDDFNGMCGQAHWANVSPECWSCWCETCGSSLNAATRRSLEIFECIFDEGLLVNKIPELACEIRAAQQECVQGDADDWDKLVAFDGCLIGMPSATEFRACDAICQLDYPGDVCERYPAPSEM